MRIGVLGAGSIGILFGTLFYQSGNDVILYNQNRTIVSSVRKHGVRLTETDGRKFRVKIPVDFPPRTLRDHDLVLVTVKAYDTIDVARRYSGSIGDTTILTLQNGLGNYEILSKYLGKTSVLVGSTSEAALTTVPGMVAHTGTGSTWIGEYDGRNSKRANEIVKAITETGLSVEGTRNIRGVLWSKAIVNSAINPVSALTRLSNGQVGSTSGLRSVMYSVITEGVRVSSAERVRLHPSSPRETMRSILRATAKNKSSMLQDVEHNRQTEIEQLNGMILRTAKKHGIRAPTTELLFQLVKALESSYMPSRQSGT